MINVVIPPLRDRKEDILELSHHFLGKYSKKLAKVIRSFTQEARGLLYSYPWPGNVRELENVIERAVIPCDSGTIGAEDLSISSYAAVAEIPINPSLEEMEKNYILRVLKEARNNQSKASQLSRHRPQNPLFKAQEVRNKLSPAFLRAVPPRPPILPALNSLLRKRQRSISRCNAKTRSKKFNVDYKFNFSVPFAGFARAMFLI